MSPAADPIRLEIRNPAEAASVCGVALRHIAARQPVNCFVHGHGASVVAFRARPEQVGARVIASKVSLTGTYTAPDRIKDAVERAVADAFRDIGESAGRSDFSARRMRL